MGVFIGGKGNPLGSPVDMKGKTGFLSFSLEISEYPSYQDIYRRRKTRFWIRADE